MRCSNSVEEDRVRSTCRVSHLLGVLLSQWNSISSMHACAGSLQVSGQKAARDAKSRLFGERKRERGTGKEERSLGTILDHMMCKPFPLSCKSRFAKDLIAEHGDLTPVTWMHRDDRYTEKLATPDVSVADLIGDADPIKAATLK